MKMKMKNKPPRDPNKLTKNHPCNDVYPKNYKEEKRKPAQQHKEAKRRKKKK